MNQQTVKRIFIAAGFFLILQYAAVGVIGYYDSEPWPAFVFPGFKSVLVFDGGFEVSRFEFHLLRAGDDPVVVTPKDLFPEIPDSQLPGFLRTRFGQNDGTLIFTQETRHWVKEQALRTAGFKPDQMMVVGLKDFYSHQHQKAVLDSVVVAHSFTFDLKIE